MTEKTAVSRRKVFIDKSFQARFILNYSLLLLVGTVLFSLAAYLILNRQIGESLFSAHLAIRRTGELLLPTLFYLSLAFIIILAAATAVVTLLVSHKISGPLFAISRYLRLLGDGKLNFEAKLRTRDQTAVLADTLSEAVHSVGGRIIMIKEAVEGLKKDLDTLNNTVAVKGAGQGDTIKALHDLGEHVRLIEERLASFETD